MPTRCHAARRTLGDDDSTDYYDADAMPMRCHAARRTRGDDDMLTYEQVTSAFDKVPPAPEPERSN